MRILKIDSIISINITKPRFFLFSYKNILKTNSSLLISQMNSLSVYVYASRKELEREFIELNKFLVQKKSRPFSRQF